MPRKTRIFNAPRKAIMRKHGKKSHGWTYSGKGKRGTLGRAVGKIRG